MKTIDFFLLFQFFKTHCGFCENEFRDLPQFAFFRNTTVRRRDDSLFEMPTNHSV